MKRTLFFAAIALIFMACEGPEGPVGPSGPAGQDGWDGRDGKDGKDGEGTNWYTAAITVDKSEWQLKGSPGDLNSYFYVYKPVSKLDNHIYQYGTVIAYLQVDEGVKNGMPYVLHKGELSEGKEFLWTQTYDYDFDGGGVGFYVTYSDFNTEIRPGSETFHIVLMW